MKGYGQMPYGAGRSSALLCPSNQNIHFYKLNVHRWFMVQVWVEPPEVSVYLSLPGTKRLGVSEGCDALLKSPDTPSKDTVFTFLSRIWCSWLPRLCSSANGRWDKHPLVMTSLRCISESNVLLLCTLFIGYTGGYGSAGLGHWYGNGGMKGPKQGTVKQKRV